MSARQSRIGKFEIIQQVGEGSASTVYLARDTIIGREIAIKTIQGAALAAPDARERFFREAQAASRLNHPNVVTVHEFGEDAGQTYLVMDFVAGKDLNQLFQDGSLKPRECLELMAQVCDALSYAHSKGACHRDLRPSNIMVTQNIGRPCAKVLDIGFTRLFGRDAAAPAPILAPEQIHPGKPDPRADVFALGMIIYEALAGTHPFVGEDEASARNRLLREDPAPLELDRLSTISPAIQGILDRALAKDPTRRFPTAAALAEALRSARDPGWSPQAESDLAARNARARMVPNLPAPAPAGPGRRYALLGLAAAVVLGGLGAGGWHFREHLPFHLQLHRWHWPVHAPAQPAVQPLPPPAPVQPPAAVVAPTDPGAGPGAGAPPQGAAPGTVAAPAGSVALAPSASAPAPQAQAPAPAPVKPPVPVPTPSNKPPVPAPTTTNKPSATAPGPNRPSVTAPAPAKPPVTAPTPSRQGTGAEPAKPQATAALRFKTLEEAQAGLGKHPAEALATFDQLLAANPHNELAMALRIATLYGVGRYGQCAKAMGEAKASGHAISDLSLKCPLLHRMLQAEKEDPKLPRRPKPANGEN